ncbi:MAG: cupredoxin domain-containing protein [Candidatus Micrarchaeota archaeon]
MEHGMKMLALFAVSGLLGLAMFAMATAPEAPQNAAGKTEAAELQKPVETGSAENEAPAGPQVVEVKALSTGFYDKQEVRVKAGEPVLFRFSAEGNAGCGKLLEIPDYNVRLISRNGETAEATFVPQKGWHAYRCGMNMFRGVLVAE